MHFTALDISLSVSECLWLILNIILPVPVIFFLIFDPYETHYETSTSLFLSKISSTGTFL